MTENEFKVLRVVEEFIRVTKRKVAAEMSITDEYGHYLLDRLANGGYIAKVGRETYILLPKGVEAIVEKFTLTKHRLEVLVDRHSKDIARVEEEITRLNKRNIFGKTVRDLTRKGQLV
ncbi:hypothetical protein MYX84_09030 [Acidobacteria bacterium AH-259-O06]|nr:hypothetical protein [Acidobacteria bacterium AH-259-O06]